MSHGRSFYHINGNQKKDPPLGLRESRARENASGALR
jgi:hypothetical protein